MLRICVSDITNDFPVVGETLYWFHQHVDDNKESPPQKAPTDWCEPMAGTLYFRAVFKDQFQFDKDLDPRIYLRSDSGSGSEYLNLITYEYSSFS